MGTLPEDCIKTDFPGLLHDSGKDKQQPVFAEPWEAHAFAIAVKLSEKGLLKWSEWSDILAEEIKEAKDQGQPDFGNTYYQFWFSALETILLEKNILKKSDLNSKIEQWRHTYLSTPHGNPVKLVKYK